MCHINSLRTQEIVSSKLPLQMTSFHIRNPSHSVCILLQVPHEQPTKGFPNTAVQ
jgi:hypothetical protein